MLKLGLESGSQEVLDAMNKGNNLARSSDALKIFEAGWCCNICLSPVWHSSGD